MNTLCADANHAAALARRTYHPVVGGVISGELLWRGHISWKGDVARLQELIDAVRSDAARLEHTPVRVTERGEGRYRPRISARAHSRTMPPDS